MEVAMGIDRIGKGGGVGKPPEIGGTPAAKETGRPFEVQKGQAPKPAEAIQKSSPLERLRAGEIDVNGYVDLKVEEATAHLKAMPADELDAIRKMLRDQMATDPALLDLVKSATGSAPSVPED
jgi:hypothetical protein